MRNDIIAPANTVHVVDTTAACRAPSDITFRLTAARTLLTIEVHYLLQASDSQASDSLFVLLLRRLAEACCAVLSGTKQVSHAAPF